MALASFRQTILITKRKLAYFVNLRRACKNVHHS